MLKTKTSPGLLLNRPLLSTDEILEALRVQIPSEYNVPIYDEYPSDPSKVRYGIYIGGVSTVSRTVNQLGIQYCGGYYNAEDEFDIVYVSYQQDPYIDHVADIINNLVTYKVGDIPLMDGYFSRTFTQSSEYGPTRAEVYTWVFNLTRLEFNT
jgi:hypothetical protein